MQRESALGCGSLDGDVNVHGEAAIKAFFILMSACLLV